MIWYYCNENNIGDLSLTLICLLTHTFLLLVFLHIKSHISKNYTIIIIFIIYIRPRNIIYTYNIKAPEAKKEDFRRYLEKSGAIDSLTSVLVGLYELESDRPIESTEYIKKFIGGGSSDQNNLVGNPGGGGGGGGGNKNSTGGVGGIASNNTSLAHNTQVVAENEKLRKENKDCKNQIRDLTRTIETLRMNLRVSRDEARKLRQEQNNQQQQKEKEKSSSSAKEGGEGK